MQESEQITYPQYLPESGVLGEWYDGAEIKVSLSTFTISANKQGLLSLASHLVALAQDEVPQGCHFHFDDFTLLVKGSSELIIEKKNFL